MSAILTAFVGLSLVLVVASLILICVAVVRAPTLPDRILALDTLTTVSIGAIAGITVATGFLLFVDVAIALGLVGFLATVAFARYVLEMGSPPPEPEIAELEAGLEPDRER